MNIMFLLLIPLATLILIGFLVLLCKADSDSWEEAGMLGTIISGAAVCILLIASFANALGDPIISEIRGAGFFVERTPYRIILRAFDREAQFTDARTVLLADHIIGARLTVKRNAWGITHEVAPPPVLEPIFAEGVEKRQ